MLLHADIEDSDQTKWMPRQTGSTCHCVGVVVIWLNFVDFIKDSLVDIFWERADLIAIRVCCFTSCRLKCLCFADAQADLRLCCSYMA